MLRCCHMSSIIPLPPSPIAIFRVPAAPGCSFLVQYDTVHQCIYNVDIIPDASSPLGLDHLPFILYLMLSGQLPSLPSSLRTQNFQIENIIGAPFTGPTDLPQLSVSPTDFNPELSDSTVTPPLPPPSYDSTITSESSIQQSSVQAQDVNLQHGINSTTSGNCEPEQQALEERHTNSRALQSTNDDPTAAQDDDDFQEPADFILDHKFTKCPCSCCHILKSTYITMESIAKLIMKSSRRYFQENLY
ncbi:hypothetical protein Y032_0084g1706 [Ancylostoma ceylanicum]|uniref:Uncharacterized protein n=1 Tax=Ancylostoma ceylanicum TaxID=53326 RepID=A0A016TPN7_9BILA|nr:hypothetical protein Y032_0084g1706 [Ancylostoma ceylanicum]